MEENFKDESTQQLNQNENEVEVLDREEPGKENPAQPEAEADVPEVAADEQGDEIGRAHV